MSAKKKPTKRNWAKFHAKKRQAKREKEEQKASQRLLLQECGRMSHAQRGEAQAAIRALDKRARKKILAALAEPTGDREKRKS